MYYCAKIKEMMKLSKETDESVVWASGGETIFVKYFEQFDDFTFQYSWVIPENDIKIQQEVHNEVNNILREKFGFDQIIPKSNVIQMGLITLYNTSGDYFSEIIGLTKNNKLQQTRNTKYVFCGEKILSVIQYHGKYSNHFECMDGIIEWNDSNIQKQIENQKLVKVARGIYCSYSKENDSVIFSLGCKNKRTIFTHNISKNIPQFLCIDSIRGITEFNLTNNVN
jgi:hypothetical protein